MDFLEKVAYKLFENHHDQMEKQVVVLPSRRAGLYLSRYLSRLSDKPQWSPGMITVTDLFASLSDLNPVTDETLIFELYNVYKARVSEPMPFDEFWVWGEIIIADYNDIDLYLADAEKLYSNITDLKEIDEKFGGLSEAQIEIIRKFWVSFNPGTADSIARTKFRSVWQLLGPVYTELICLLRSKGYAGEGMLCREVAEKAEAGKLLIPEGITYHITGLNALNECEKRLFRYMKEKGRARFYWDDDHSFMSDPDHKASVFIKENLKIFPNEIINGDNKPEVVNRDRWIIIDTPSDVAQAKMLPQLLTEALDTDTADLTDTAIILADEKLLLPVLTSLPSEIEEVNVTMGHPFRFTPLYSFIRQLFILARSARRSGEIVSLRAEDILVLLRHQYFRLLSGNKGEKVASEMIRANMIRVDTVYLSEQLRAEKLFLIPVEGSEFPSYLISILEEIETRTFDLQGTLKEAGIDREYIRMALSEIRKLQNLINDHKLSLKTDTCIRLIDRILKRLIVPFSGEPLKGIQVMGVLETRALEFRNFIFLSLNEGVFPNKSYETTFIPYNIRRAFGLPTVNEHESIYSYHFFRLLRKPRLGRFIYNSSSQGLNTGEMSRYLVQMKYSTLFQPEFRTMSISVGRSRKMPDTVKKDAGHISFLTDKYSVVKPNADYLSPSAINTWMSCRMKFYYMYVCGLPEEEKLEKDIDQRRFGNILHNVMHDLYLPLVEDVKVITGIKKLAEAPDKLKKVIIITAAREMKWSEENLLAGKSVIILDVIERYVKDILAFDSNIPSLIIMSLEEKFSKEFETESGKTKLKLRIGGRIDRVDRADGVMRVVDYKTGSPKKEPDSVDNLFDETNDKKNDAVLQTMLYCSILSDIHHNEPVLPAIYWIQKISSRDFNPASFLKEFNIQDLNINSWSEVMSRFNEGLTKTISNIFSDGQDFTMTEFEHRCTYCPFKRLCRR